MTDPLFWHRLQFGFTVTYHYLFPQLTMGLALFIVLFKWYALRTQDAHWDAAARFWAKIFALNFAVGVVSGIPMEFQFGTNWARFSAISGGVIGTTLAMEGMFAFFLESTFLGLFLYGEKRLSPKAHFASAVALFFGSWLSGYFIIATNAFMQHPVGFSRLADGRLVLSDFWAFVLNPWARWQYAHNMTASVVTASFVVCGISAFWLLMGLYRETAARCLRVGVIAAAISCVLQLFPTGDSQGKLVADHQPVALAAMEGVFTSGPGAKLALIGQPDVRRGRLENPIEVPGLLSFLAYGSFGSTVLGLNDVPHELWPDNMELTYYCYHVMVGLGTLFILLGLLSLLRLIQGKLFTSRWLLWVWMLAIPFPYIANTAGWMTAELGRQPWAIHGLLRTALASSPRVGAGDAIFTFIGFCGLYLVVGLLFLYLVGREIAHGPSERPPSAGMPTPSALGTAGRA
ncbi:MAG: cytochrome ubiquinol oxidase subunit I [Myxococcaceae bacterium]